MFKIQVTEHSTLEVISRKDKKHEHMLRGLPMSEFTYDDTVIVRSYIKEFEIRKNAIAFLKCVSQVDERNPQTVFVEKQEMFVVLKEEISRKRTLA
jgi:hypothetical protein